MKLGPMARGCANFFFLPGVEFFYYTVVLDASGQIGNPEKFGNEIPKVL